MTRAGRGDSLSGPLPLSSYPLWLIDAPPDKIRGCMAVRECDMGRYYQVCIAPLGHPVQTTWFITTVDFGKGNRWTEELGHKFVDVKRFEGDGDEGRPGPLTRARVHANDRSRTLSWWRPVEPEPLGLSENP